MKRLKAIYYLLTCKDYIVITLSDNLRYKSFLKGQGSILTKMIQLFNACDNVVIQNNPERNFND